MKPARGYIFVVPVDEIPSIKSEAGFGVTHVDKQKPEQPYKFKVIAVGAPRPFDGLMIDSEVSVGDTISLMSSNNTLREQRETTGFLIGSTWIIPVDFRDILGIWDGLNERP